MPFPRAIRKSVARKLLAAVAGPAVLLVALAVAWLRAETIGYAPRLWHAVAAGAAVVGLGILLVHFAAVTWLVKRPLRALARAVRGARAGEGLVRIPVEGEDEIAQVAEAFNAAMQAMTDLQVARTDDALQLAAMQREVRLHAELEAQHRLLDRTNRELEGRFRELEILAGLSHKLNATLDLQALCDAVTEAVAQQLGFEGFALLLVDEQRGDLVVRAALGTEGRAVGARLALGEGAAGIAARERQLVLVRDVESDPRLGVRSWLPAGAGSLLAAPMVHQGECVGVLDFWRPEADAFSKEDVRFLGSIADQASIALANARLHAQAVSAAVTDPLTGALNRRGLSERLRHELDRASRFGTSFGLAIVDVDRLKAFLEGRGLAAGDAVLRALTRLLQAELRDVDALARYRGDKFAIVIPRADRAEATRVAERLRRAVEAAELDGGARITVSAGVASYPEDGGELEALLQAADAALYAAKRSGRNAVRALG